MLAINTKIENHPEHYTFDHLQIFIMSSRTSALHNLMIIMDKMQSTLSNAESTPLIKSLSDQMTDSMQALSAIKSQIDTLKQKEKETISVHSEMTLEMDTVQEQLALHIRHHENDKMALLTAMDQIEDLKRRNVELEEALCDELESKHENAENDKLDLDKIKELNELKERNMALEEALCQEMESNDRNQRQIGLLSESAQNEDIGRLMRSREKKHCQVLALQAVIERLRKKGVDIPAFPAVERMEKSVQSENKEVWFSKGCKVEDDQKDREINSMMVQIKALRSRKSKIIVQSVSKSRIVQIAFCAAFAAGIMYRRPAPLQNKVLL